MPGESFDWYELATVYGVVRNPYEIDPPGRTRELMYLPGDNPIVRTHRPKFVKEKPSRD